MNRKIMKQEATYDFLKDEVHCLYDEKKELQERIDKVIECLEEGIDFPYYDDDTKKYLKGMKDILKGEDK